MVPTDPAHPGPLASWRTIGSFDTALQCEAGLNKEANRVNDPNTTAKIAKKIPEWNTDRALARLKASACIATDDPRLAK